MLKKLVHLLLSLVGVFTFLTPVRAEIAHGNCRDVFGTRPRDARLALERSRSLKSWHFTDPLAHTPENYTYLVHAFRPDVDPVDVYRRLTNPSETEFKLISASVINQDNPTTMRDVGFILEASADSIVAAHHQDMMIRNVWHDGDTVSTMLGRPTDFAPPLGFDQSVDELYRLWGLPSLAEITRPGKLQNEVAIERLNSRGLPSLKIKAVFYRRYPPVKPWFEDMNVETRRIAGKAARALRLPLIEIEVKMPAD